MRALVLLLVCATILDSPSAAQGTRPTGRIGTYVPPRAWPAPPRNYDLLHQRIALHFDMSRRRVKGQVTTEVVILAHPTDSVRLDAERLTIDAASDASGRPLGFTSDAGGVTVQLGRRAARGDTVDFSLTYHTVPERGVYFVPRSRMIWSQGEPIETRAWVPTFNAADDKTTWELLVTADTGLKVLSNGRLVEVVPASGGAQQVWHWAQEKPASTYLYSVVVGPFAILRDRWRDIPVDYWVDPDSVVAGWRTFGETPSMIELYSRLLGVNFPWNKYDQSAIPDFVYGGMENVSATTQTDLILHSSDGEPQWNGRSLVSHELAHQWFGDLITASTWAHVWLNEGLATYMESVHQEASRGREAAQLNWWDQQQQSRWADENLERPLVWGEYQGDDPTALFASGHVYAKGAQVAHQLRRLLGDSVFWRGMRRFLVDNAYQPVETSDFAIAMEKTCRCDLDWFFDQWAYGRGSPQVMVTRHWNSTTKRLDVTVEQTQTIDSLHPRFRFPTTIRVITRDSVVRLQFTVSKVKETFPLRLPGTPLSFRFDEGGWLLGTVRTDQTLEELAELAEHDLDLSARIWALRRLDTLPDSAAVAARRFIMLNEPEPLQRVRALVQSATDRSHETAAIIRAALRDPDSDVRAQAIRTFGALDATGADTLAERMYRTDPNTSVRIAALSTCAKIAGARALPLLVGAAAVGLPFPLRAAAAWELAKIHDPQAADALESLTLPREPRELRVAGLDGLAAQSDSVRAAAVASKYLDDHDPLFAAAAVRTLGKVGGTEGRARLRTLEGEERRVTVKAAIEETLKGR